MQAGKKKNNRRLGFLITALIIAGALILLIGIYHQFFRVKTVEVSGLQRINQKEFSQAVLGIIDYRKFWILPGDSYFLINVTEVKDIIKDRFPIEYAAVKKKFPATLTIQVEEKISTLIFDNGKDFCYLDTNGNVVEKVRQVGNDEWREKIQITTSTNEKGELEEKKEILERTHAPDIKRIKAEMGDYPIIFDKRGQDAILNTSAINHDLVSGIIEWFNFLNKKTDVLFGYVIIGDERGEGEIVTGRGWRLRVKLIDGVELQFSELQHLLTKEKINRENLNYIDLRYLGKVYWK
ncbi:MAG: FtsQ-type POTRA domain-containing protein [Candidatus Magasanikbacteria bacterium]|nr:FtsQ-type POTRA domain-containing protein [Candidatus Magasanikbacteria bacterium]